MPYIKQERRQAIEEDWHLPETEGELNFIITLQIKDFLRRKGKSYATMNAIIGVLESVKLEFYRRVVSPYEQEKIKENGDVY